MCELSAMNSAPAWSLDIDPNLTYIFRAHKAVWLSAVDPLFDVHLYTHTFRPTPYSAVGSKGT